MTAWYRVHLAPGIQWTLSKEISYWLSKVMIVLRIQHNCPGWALLVIRCLGVLASIVARFYESSNQSQQLHPNSAPVLLGGKGQHV